MPLFGMFAISESPAEPGHLKLATDRIVKRDYDAALVAVREALRLEPKNWKGHFLLGSALAGKADIDGSIAAFRETVRLNPLDANAHTELGLSLGRKFFGGADAGVRNILDEGVNEFRTAIRLDPNLAGAHAGIGSALMMVDDVEGAIAAYREAIRLDPKLLPAHAYLALLLEMKGDSKGAADHRRIADDLKASGAWEGGPKLPTEEHSSQVKGIARPLERAKNLDALFNVTIVVVLIIGIVNVVRAPSEWIRQCLAAIVGYFGVGNISLFLKYTGIYPPGFHEYPVGGKLLIFDCPRSILWQAIAYACLLSFNFRGGIKFGAIAYLAVGLLWTALGFALRKTLWGETYPLAYPGRRLITESLWRCIGMAVLIAYF